MGGCGVVRDRMRFVAKVAPVACAFCALTVFAAEPRRTIDASRVLDGGPLGPPPSDLVVTSTPPDPQPMDLPVPQATPRAMGRFAIELFEGAALLERVRFDFPLLGALEASDGGWNSAPSLTQKLRTRIGVVFPAARRGTRLELVDRATNRRWSLPWPPDEPGDAGASS